MSFGKIVIRTVVGFFLLFILTRILGKKEISQLNFFNFVSAIAIGSIASDIAIDENLKMLDGIISLIGWCLFTLILDFLDIKSKSLRKIINGEPVIIVREGKIMHEAMKKVRLDLDSFNAMLREKNIFSVTDVEYAIFETNGKLSVLPKETKKPVTKSDLNIPVPKTPFSIPLAVIEDGQVLHKILEKMNLDENWIYQQLRQQNIQSVDEVFFAQIQTNGTLYIDKKMNQQ